MTGQPSRRRRSDENPVEQKPTGRGRRGANYVRPLARTWKDDIKDVFRWLGDRGLPDWEQKAEIACRSGLAYSSGKHNRSFTAPSDCGRGAIPSVMGNQALVDVWQEIAATVGEYCSGETIVAYPVSGGWQVARSGYYSNQWAEIFETPYSNKSKALLEARRIIKFQQAKWALAGAVFDLCRSTKFRRKFGKLNGFCLVMSAKPAEFWSR